MSGGSYNYIYSRLEDECFGRMYDTEMNDMINDLCSVLRALEWWQSCDTSEWEYRESLSEFKKKWFNGNREERLKEDSKILYDVLTELEELKQEFKNDGNIHEAIAVNISIKRIKQKLKGGKEWN